MSIITRFVLSEHCDDTHVREEEGHEPVQLLCFRSRILRVFFLNCYVFQQKIEARLCALQQEIKILSGIYSLVIERYNVLIIVEIFT